MWDTAVRIPFDASLLTDRGDAAGRDRLLALIARVPGITVEELSALGLRGLFADLRALYRDGWIAASPEPARFFDRATRVSAL